MFSAQAQFGDSAVEQIVERMLRPAFACTRLAMILALQEPTSWDVENLCLSGFVFHGCKTCSTAAFVSDQIRSVQMSWRTEQRCTAVLFKSVMVVGFYTLDSATDFAEYEKFMGELTKAILEGRKEGARRFIVAGDPKYRFRCTVHG